MTASGHVRIGRHLLGIRAVKHVLAAGAAVTLRLTLSQTLRKLVRSALHRHRHPRVAVTLRAVDVAGNATTRRFTIVISG